MQKEAASCPMLDLAGQEDCRIFVAREEPISHSQYHLGCPSGLPVEGLAAVFEVVAAAVDEHARTEGTLQQERD